MVEPYYQDDWATLYHGDCRDVLHQLEHFDLCLTDPPYGAGMEYDEWDDTEENLRVLIATTIDTVLDSAGATLLTSGVRNQWLYPRPRGVLAWVGTSVYGAPRRWWGFEDWQPILAYGADPYYKNQMGGRSSVIQCAPEKVQRSIHPCPKPLGVWKKILLRGSPRETDTIVDPFAGAGTTLRAAKDLGRKSVGIELSEAYCEEIAKNLSQEVFDFTEAA